MALVVGANPRGSASSRTPVSRCTVAVRANRECGRPVMAISGQLNCINVGNNLRISSVSPLCEMISTTSLLVIIPRSPWAASTAWTKRAGVPSEAKVAASFRPIRPDFPTPIKMTCPSQLRIICIAETNEVSKVLASLSSAAASLAITARANMRVVSLPAIEGCESICSR